MTKKPRKPPRGGPRRHWYLWHLGECPVCGRDQSYKERVYGRRPKRPWRRVLFMSGTETYDHCLER